MQVDYDLVYNTYMKLRSNVRNKKSIFYFELLLNSNINYIVNKINNNDYKLGNYNIFFIKEKKYRLILSNNIFDKIYNHLVSELILSKLDKYLIDSNVASRVGRGTRYARCLLHRYLCELKSNNKEFYILKFDIKKYFFNIDHNILIPKLSKYLNKDELVIIKDILNSTNKEYINICINKINNKYNLDLPLYKKDVGIVIGFVCNQMFAILDRLIKDKLGCKYYIKYMDDGIFKKGFWYLKRRDKKTIKWNLIVRLKYILVMKNFLF